MPTDNALYQLQFQKWRPRIAYRRSRGSLRKDVFIQEQADQEGEREDLSAINLENVPARVV